MFKEAFVAAIAVITAMPLAAQQPAQQGVIATGGFLLARDLYTSCSSSQEREALACRAYLMGIADSMVLHKDNRWAPPVLCNAEDMHITELGSIYTDYMRRNQEKADWTAASTAYNALSERFPCPAPQPGG